VRRTPDAPLGFTLSGLAAGTSHGGHPCSSRALRAPVLRPESPAPRSVDQFQPRPIRNRRTGARTWQPSQGSRTGPHPCRSSETPSGLSFSPRAAPRIAADCRRSYGRSHHSTVVARA